MSDPLYTNDGLFAASMATKEAVFEICKIGLFTNNHTPSPGDTIGDYDEPTWTGYVRQGPATWSTPDIVADVALTSPGEVHWEVGGSPGAETVIGWFLVDEDNGLVIFAEKLTTAIVPTLGVDVVIDVTMRFRNP